MVTKMLERTGAELTRPQGLAAGFGMTDAGYRLSDAQAQAILDLRLQRLTALEQDKIFNEFSQILDLIGNLLGILAGGERLLEVIREELVEIRGRYGDERRTEIVHDRLDVTTEDLIVEEDVVVTLSHVGYAKAQPVADYRAQRRGGRGKTATRTKDEDFVAHLFVVNTHDTILCFSNYGKVYWLKVYQLPQAGRIARGKPLVQLLPLAEDEKVTAVLPVRKFEETKFVFMATAAGTVKKCSLMDFSRPRSSGIWALKLGEADELVGVGLTDGSHDIMLFASTGKAIRFAESDVRAMGRTARGVRGISLKGGKLISLINFTADAGEHAAVLTATENGYGKRTATAMYSRQRRGGQGVISIQVKGRNGAVVGAELVAEEDEVMLITDGGTLIRTRVNEISLLGRNTAGVRLIDLHEEERLVGIGKVEESASDEAEQDA